MLMADHRSLRCLHRIFTFDHTVGNPRPPSFVKYFSLGLGPQTGGQIATLSEMMRQTNTTEQDLELLKIDIEGFEYKSLLPLLRTGTMPRPRQLLIEMHARSTVSFVNSGGCTCTSGSFVYVPFLHFVADACQREHGCVAERVPTERIPPAPEGVQYSWLLWVTE